MPAEHPPPLSGRRRRHALVIPLVLCYLTAALVAAVVPDHTGLPRWLALHLLFLGAATNAIAVYSSHFGETLLHARPASVRWQLTQLVVLNAGVLAVLAGVAGHQPVSVVAGAALVVAATAGGAARLARLARRSLAGKLRPAVWFYAAATAFLAVGATSGAFLGSGHAGGTRSAGYLVTLHAHVNLFGWVGLTVLGTMFMLWPAALRTRMSATAPTVARRVLAPCAVGLLVAAAALLAHRPGWAAVGMLGYIAGIGWSLDPLLRAAATRRPRGAASASLAAGTGWLLGAAVWDAIALATRHANIDAIADRLAPMLAVGLVAQVLLGALSFLLPVLLGGGPTGAKQAAGILDRFWPARLALTNLGLVVTLLPLPAVAGTLGYAAALTGLGAFLPLAAVTILKLLHPQRAQ